MDYSQLGGAGLLAFIIIREVLAFARARQSPLTEDVLDTIHEIQAKVAKLYEWHDKDNPLHPGAKAWYTTQTETEMLRLQENVTGIHATLAGLKDIANTQNETLRGILAELKRTR